MSESASDRHTFTPFDTDLAAMRGMVDVIAQRVERQVVRGVDAVLAGDLAQVMQVLAEEREINDLCVAADAHCSHLIARHQPTAIDLREVVAAMHMVNDMERIGDEAKKVALRAQLIAERGLPVDVAPLAEMSGTVMGMLRGALDAFRQRDASAAAVLAQRDRRVDALRDQTVAALTARMAADAAIVPQALALVFVVQSLERMGDHAREIADYVVHVAAGVDVRHRPAERPGA
jgi:phosphate transport system protein